MPVEAETIIDLGDIRAGYGDEGDCDGDDGGGPGNN